MGMLQTREDFDRYHEAFHSGDCDTAFDYYVDEPRLRLFGIEITNRLQLRRHCRFLHEHVRKSVRVERFAMSDDFLAIEMLLRVEGLRDMDNQRLREQGMLQFQPIAAGEVQVMRNFVHYRLRDGKIESGTTVRAP
jgi:hypothetical protein